MERIDVEDDVNQMSDGSGRVVDNERALIIEEC